MYTPHSNSKYAYNAFGIGWFKFFTLTTIMIGYSFVYYNGMHSTPEDIVLTWIYSIVLSVLAFYSSYRVNKMFSPKKNDNEEYDEVVQCFF